MKNRSRTRPLLLLTALLVALTAVAAGGSSASRSGVAGAQHTLKAARLTVRSTDYGKSLFGPSGKVLYVFDADRRNKSRCYGDCAAAWPPLLTKGNPIAGPGVKAGLLGTTRRANGRLQVTYDGHPLYYYVGDPVGKVLCQHVDEYGGLWLIIKPNGMPNMAKSPHMM